VNYEIVELEEFTGTETTIYSVILEGEEQTLFDDFLQAHKNEFKQEIKSILSRLVQIGKETGARNSFFKHDEGTFGDAVCALYDTPECNLRLYCIRLGMDIIIVGGGGRKTVRAWQDDENLAQAAGLMIACCKDITHRIKSGDLYWSDNKKSLEGNLKNYEDDETD
jgi:hypothetical protein